MASSQSSNFEILTLQSNDQQRTVDLRGGTISVSYYEDIFSPSITAKIQVVNTGDSISPKDKTSSSETDGPRQSIYNGLPLRGGERLELKILDKGENKSGIDFSSDNQKHLYVSSITDIVSTPQTESFTLNLSPKESFSNETTRVQRKYANRIDVTVKQILKNVIHTSNFKNKNIDAAGNEYSFIGNMKKPFTVLVSLAAKAVPDGGKNATAGFVFYQTQDGFNFKSIDGLIKQKPKATYYYTEVNQTETDVNNDFKILNYYTERNQNLIQKLRLGSYASQRMFFNPLNFSFTPPEQGKFQFSKYQNKLNNLGTDGKVDLPKMDQGSDISLGDVPTRILSGIVDIGTMEKDVSLKAAKEKSKIGGNGNPLLYQSQSIMRYNMLFTQSINMMISCNTNLRAGDVIQCEFPKISEGPDEMDTEQSGLYMIKELCHHFETNKSYTSMKLIRDNFGINKK